ncbi:MAG: hypothetical protein OEY94_02170 [Alphaproteobacteria bacterium]|nr:hypothetical protein [Alphaproteobacteria bacterium]
MTYDHLAPIPVYAASYEVINDKGETRIEGFIGDPAQSITDYFRHRYTPNGSNGKLVVRIVDSSITHRMLQSDNRMGALLGVDRDDEYTIKAQVDVQLYGSGAYRFQEVRINATQIVAISEHKSLVDREKLQMEAIDRLIGNIDKETQKILNEKFDILN